MRGLAHHTVTGGSDSRWFNKFKRVCQSEPVALRFVLCPSLQTLSSHLVWPERGVLSLEGGRKTGARVFPHLCFRWPLQQGLCFLPGPGGPTWPAVQAPLLLPLTSQVPLPPLALSSHCPAALGIQPFPFVLLALGMGWVSDIGDL